MQKLNLTDFKTKIQEDKLNIVMFHTAWCASCREIFPQYEKASMRIEFIKYGFYDVDVDECLELADEYKIDELPVIIAFKKGKQVSKWCERDGKIEEWLKFLNW